MYEETEGGRPLHTGDGFSAVNPPAKSIFSQKSIVQIVFHTNSIRNGLGWNITFSTSKLFRIIILCIATSMLLGKI